MASASGNGTYHYTLTDIKKTSSHLIDLATVARSQLRSSELHSDVTKFAQLATTVEAPARTNHAVAEFVQATNEVVHTEADTLHAVGLILEDLAQHLAENDSQAALAMRNTIRTSRQP